MNYCGNEYCTYQPYMDDYNEPWTNERFYDFFKITDNEKKLIQERIKTIYWKNI